MKRKIMVILMIFTFAFITFFNTKKVYTAVITGLTLLGDANSDGIVNISDVKRIAQYIINLSSIDDINIDNADYNNDSNIKLNDAMLILSNIQEKPLIALNDTNIYINSSKQIECTIGEANCSDIANMNYSWQLNDSSLATIDEDGVITTSGTPGRLVVELTIDNGQTEEKISANVNIVGERIHFIAQTSENTSGTPLDTCPGVSPKGNSGDAILVESKEHYAMIDTGDSTAWNQIKNYLDSQNVDTLEFILLTHMHSDHVGNIERLLKTYKVNNIYMKKYCQDGNNDNKYQNIYDCSEFPLTITDEDKCTIEPKSTNSTNLEGTARWQVKIKCLVNNYNKTHSNDNLTITYVNNTDLIPSFIDKTFDNLNYKMTLYQNELVSAEKVNVSDNYNSIITTLESPSNKIALLTADAYDTEALNNNVDEIRNKRGNQLIDVLKVPHHGSRACAMLTKNDISTNLLKNVGHYVITASTKRLNLLRESDTCSEVDLCVDVFKYPTGSYKYYVDECTYDAVNDKYKVGSVIADMTNETVKIEKIIDGELANCQTGTIIPKQ